VETLNDVTKSDQQSLLENSTKFLFVRDPYHRLYSGYVDKFLSPNTVFWKGLGRPIIQRFRRNASETELRCGHNVSFRELVKFFIDWMKNENSVDGHFSPEYLHCDPCFYRYDMIGKFETMEEDTIQILKTFGLKRLFEPLNQEFHQRHLLSTIKFEFHKLFLYYNYYNKEYHSCLSFREALNLVWQKLKINGLIKKNFQLSDKYYIHENISKEELTTLAENNIGDVLNKDIAQKNREEAFLEAYSSVEKEDMIKLREIFLPDCEIFGYDCEPYALFHGQFC